jgi:hypothetical protein
MAWRGVALSLAVAVAVAIAIATDRMPTTPDRSGRAGRGDEARTLRPLQAAAVTERIAFGPRAGQQVLTLLGAERGRGTVPCLAKGSPMHSARGRGGTSAGR